MSIEIFNADCFDIFHTIKEKSIDLVILDLPYGQTGCNWDIPINLTDLWVELKRIGKPNTPFIFFTTTKFGYKLIEANEKWFRYDLVWNKMKNVGFLNARKMPMRTHEMIYIFYDKLPAYNIEKYHSYSESTREDKNKILPKNVYRELLERTRGLWTPRLPISIIDSLVTKERYHQTMKPNELLVWLIKYYSNDGATILDPTMGSGSTGVACKELQRNFIGIEKDKSIFETAEKRLNDIIKENIIETI